MSRCAPASRAAAPASLAERWIAAGFLPCRYVASDSTRSAPGANAPTVHPGPVSACRRGASAVDGDLDRVGGRRVVGAREAQRRRRRSRRARSSSISCQSKVLAPVAADERAEVLLEALGRVHREPLALEPVPQEHVEAVDVDAVVGMLVREHDRGEVLRGEVLLQVAERAVAAVHPDRGRRPSAPGSRCTRRCAARRRSPSTPAPSAPLVVLSPRTTARRGSTSGPRNRPPSVPERRRCRRSSRRRAVAGGAATRRRLGGPSRSRTANAVSSALDTSTTSRPITSPMVRARSG